MASISTVPETLFEVSKLANQPRLATESIAGQRPYQEDNVLAKSLDDGRTLVAVADGMGGHAAGDVASALAMETLVDAIEAGQSLSSAFTLANSAVHTKSREPGKQGMGTTLVAALVDGGEFHVANVGDSRCYLMTGDGIQQLSEDHSFVAEAMKRGQSEEEALTSKFKDALTRSIGIDEEVQVDTFGPFPVEDGTALFLCSDGLYKVMNNDRIRSLFGLSGGPRGAAQSMVATAFEDGSDDNISVAIAEWGEVTRERQMGTMPIEFVPPSADDGADEAGAAPAAPIAPESPAPEAEAATPAAAAPVAVQAAGPPMGLILGIGVVIITVALYWVLGR
ncbi:MAG: serine/threonine-protein phosphatase [Gemmatimonadales bacterium]|jgi:protein phosphatase|nr:serine/threonine-protein phosphatase [Gemmatimonadales bacterium]MBT3957588.1 serine/threonine-protein phosphatase [Gemmatimonadales bacterium]MBT4186488.1 serine/threonine-protein phosphatase [Gemmatimonadales bacterium]MBT5697607.1 serine/threonine-protein phosphatase [Gemmatimonadales bacterium]MBT6697006.1 serine/threonine-protein phosphatase [Gemmatimonadales bacterium]